MKQKIQSHRKLRTPKTILRLPDLEVAKSDVLNSLSCPDAQRGYAPYLRGVLTFAITESTAPGAPRDWLPFPSGLLAVCSTGSRSIPQ